MLGAGACGHLGNIAFGFVRALAEPFEVVRGEVRFRLGFCRGVAGDEGQVLRDCKGGVAVCVVGAEAEDGNFDEGRVGDIVQCGDPWIKIICQVNAALDLGS